MTQQHGIHAAAFALSVFHTLKPTPCAYLPCPQQAEAAEDV
jgi:hypothetical protein